jgi:hypothetical protein
MEKEPHYRKYIRTRGDGCIRYQTTAGHDAVLMTSSKEVFGQGVLLIDGVPSGGFSVVPREWLDPEKWNEFCESHARNNT